MMTVVCKMCGGEGKITCSCCLGEKMMLKLQDEDYFQSLCFEEVCACKDCGGSGYMACKYCGGNGIIDITAIG